MTRNECFEYVAVIRLTVGPKFVLIGNQSVCCCSLFDCRSRFRLNRQIGIQYIVVVDLTVGPKFV